MPTHTLTFHIAAIGPSDTEQDVEVVRGVVGALSEEFASRSVTVAFHHWSDLPPGLGSSAQGYIDQSISWPEMDFVVGLLWERFGTSLDGKLSGTEHEYRQVYDLFSKRQKPDVLFYFKSPASGEENPELQLVRAFKKDVRGKALTGNYDSSAELREKLMAHLREKILQRLATNNQQQRRLGDLPSNSSLTVEMLFFAEFPSEDVCIPVIILLKNPRGEEFVFDTRTMNPQLLANWIAQSFGYAATPRKTLFEYLQQYNIKNFEEAWKKRDQKALYINQMWLGNILFCNHPGMRLKHFKICLGSTKGAEVLKEFEKKKRGPLYLELQAPQIINHPDGTKTLLL